MFRTLLRSVAKRIRCRPAGFLEIAPRYRAFFHKRGLLDAAAFLDLPGATPHIVSGHPDRHVVRLSFGVGRERWIAFLKREQRVSRRVRLGNALAGFGFVSRSLREARMLQALEREAIRGPEWLAAGEDGRGRAFLLVRRVKGAELRSFLRKERDAARRRRIAHKLGALLARLHNAGYRHPDLYANHFFIERNGEIRILDWQRARLNHAVSWRERCRDLASLHATVDDALATPRERLICLLAYRKASSSLSISWGSSAHGIDQQARHLLARRHISEKRQPPARRQAWICLDGDALCITPTMQRVCGRRPPNWLLQCENDPALGEPLTRRWADLPGGIRALLVRRGRKRFFSELWDRLRRHSRISPEQRQAALLLRLQRHSIPAPQVLALGRPRSGESFLLTEPLTETCSLEAWLACQTRRCPTAEGRKRQEAVLSQAGALLRRLHEASCYLAFGAAGCGLAVCGAEGKTTVVLDGVENLIPCRRRQPRRAVRDVRQLQHTLCAVGCSRADLRRFRDGYSPPFCREPAASARFRTRRRLAAKREDVSDVRSLWNRFWQGTLRSCYRPDWPRFVGADWAKRVMDARVTDRFVAKQGRTTGRWILHASEARRLSVYLKRHYELPCWRRWLALLFPRGNWSPALRERANLEWAREQGIPTPNVVAAAEYIGPGGRLRSFLAVEELAGMASLPEAIPLAGLRQDATAFRHWKGTLTAEMARLACILHDRRCFHKDLYLCHFYIAREDTRAVPPDGWRGRVYLIDLHRLAHHPHTHRLWQAKDLAQLLYSSEILGVTARDRLHFWRAYRGFESRGCGSAWLRRFILFKWRRYRHHNARNRQPRQAGQAPT